MSTNTGIEWTDATWNPIRGCSRVSEGCRNCYAEKVVYRFSDEGAAYHGLVGIGGKWNGQIKFVEDHLLDPLKWRKPRRIFVNSMSDLFHENVTDEMLDQIFSVMAHSPQHTFQVLTKRPERMLAYISSQERVVSVYDALVDSCIADHDRVADRLICRGQDRILKDDPAHGKVFDCQWPLPNVWLGVSVENQKAADERIPLLLRTPAAVRFISAEPLLGPVDLDAIGIPLAGHRATFSSFGGYYVNGESCKLDWVICGGESGPGSRPMHPDWARGLRDQCSAADVPFFFKQWGHWMDGSDFRDTARAVLNDGRVIQGDPADLPQEDRNRWASFNARMMAPVGKKLAGNLLDGKEWRQFPEVS